MYSRRALLPLLLLLIVGAAHTRAADTPVAPEAGVAVVTVVPAEAEPAKELSGQILYQLLLAEIAGQRSQWPLASAAYLDLAQKTRDARIARRATEIGMHANNHANALAAALLWSELAPNDPAAVATLTNLYVLTQKGDDLATTLKRSLTNAGADLAPTLLRLNRTLARQTNKTAVLHLIEELTLPYLTMPEARFVRAQAAANAKDALKTQAEIDQALSVRPDWEMAALFKFQQLPAGDAALRFATDFLNRYPDARELRLGYARMLVGEKRYDEAHRQFLRLHDTLPENADIAYATAILALQLDNPKDAEGHLKKVIELDQGPTDSARFYLGQIAEFDQRTDDALNWYRLVDNDEHRLNAILRGAALLLRQERFDDARAWLRESRHNHPEESQKIYLAESQLLREHARHDDVRHLFDEALKRHPDDPELLYEAGLNADKLDNIPLLEQRFRRLIALRPQSPQGYNALGYSFADRNMRLKEAETLIDKAMALAPEDYYILDSKGWVLFRLGRFDESLTFLHRAYALKPEPEIAAHIGEVLWAQGKHGEAEAFWRTADKANPGNSDLTATIKRFLP